MNSFGFPVLSIITFAPLVAALVIMLFVRNNDTLVKWISLVSAIISLVLTVVVLFSFDTTVTGMQFVENIPWISSVGINYYMGVDGLAILLVFLSALLTVISLIASWDVIKVRVKEYYIAFLILEVGMLGVFMGLNFFVFYIFWELVLIPMALLIGIWGGGRRIYSAIKFFLYTLAGSLLMLVGIIAIYFEHGNITGVYTLNILELSGTPYGMAFQLLVFVAFFLAFAIKVPMWPLHTWLPDAHVDAPTAGSVVLAGVLLKMGGYGFLRISLPILPDASVAAAPWVIGLSVIAILYGAYVTLVQKDLKKLVAYSSVSHMGFVTLGIFLFSVYGLQGAIIIMFSHGLLTGGLFLVVGVIYERLHTRQIGDLGGVATPMPAYAAMAGILMLGSLGLPGLSGFVGEFLVFLAAFKSNTWLAVAVVFVVILAAGYLLWMFQRVFYLGKPKSDHHLIDISWKEGLTIVPLVALSLFIGVYPAPVLNLVSPAVQQIIEQVNAQGPVVASLFMR